MIVRRCLTLTIPIWLILSIEFGAIEAERWSRQVSNSEWIPLADPRSMQTQLEQSSQSIGLLSNGNSQLPQIPSLSLPPALQQQYQEQLLQLQKTQESIQKLLLLQQQLRTQQHLLQSQTLLPSGFGNSEEEKRLQQSGLANTQTEFASEDLVPPVPASETLPPVFSPQSFLPQRPRPTKQELNIPQEFTSLPGQGFTSNHGIQQSQNIEENQRQGAKHLKESHHPLLQQPENGQDEEEEVQLVYVPAETLAQRGQKRGRGRKQYPHRNQQHRENQGVDSSSSDQDAFARQVLQQIQMEREQKVQFLNEERMKEIARLNEEQKALERKTRLQHEALQREQELQRQREAEKKKKELEKLEEMAKQRELERIREAREKQRLEELERRRLAEIRAREEKRRAEEAARQREAERLAALERQKQLEMEQALKQQQILDKQREDEARATSATIVESQGGPTQALPLIRDQQLHRQHLTETSKPLKSKSRGRQRQRNQYQEQQNYRETTTTPSPNQPPLSVYMGSLKTSSVKVSDVLKILKDAKTIAVLDTVGPQTPQVFVGPTNLDPPTGYAKFDLPYLSSIDHNRVERKVDKLPFFVAPLSFDPPAGYSKIPFPAPHIGSVVVNTLDNTDSKDGDDQNPSPTPLIEPNSYIDGLDGGSESTTPLYEPQTTVGYNQESSNTPKYEQTYSSTPSSGYSGSRFRFKQFYGDNKPASVISTGYYDDQRPTTRKHKYYEENLRTTETPVQSSKVETAIGHVDEVSYSTTPSFTNGPIGPQDSATKSQDLAAQLALINEELNHQRESQRYNFEEYSQQGSQSTGLGNGYEGEVSVGGINDVRNPVGPTQYNLPAELPAISPHLPGLVNSLLDKNEAKHQASTAAITTTTTSTTTTTTTTQRTPTTTYRPRGRQRSRVSSTRPRTTTQATYTRTNPDRSRRPYNRSRSRFSTTTEEYRDSYDPTKSRIPETTLRYSNVEHRRPSSNKQKYRGRDRTNLQSEQAVVQGHNIQNQQAYESTSQSDSGSQQTANDFLQPSAPDTTLRQLDSSLNDYTPEHYPSTTVSTTESYPSLPVNHGASLLSEDYTRRQNYPQNLAEDSRYRGTYDQSTLEHSGLEKTPVNGFNYQVHNGETLEQGILQRPKEYQLDGKAENSDYDLATTPDPRLRNPEEHRYSSIYEVNVPQSQPEYSLTGQDSFSQMSSEKVQTGALDGSLNEPPIFVPLPENKQEDYVLAASSTESPSPDITTETTTTSTTPLVIRQRVRGRVGTRLHHDSSIQTRPRGSQDEYVRFSVVNQDSTRNSPSRQRTRTRSRTQNQGSHVQTDGNEYIKIHAVQQKQIVTTTSAPLTTTTERPAEEDIDYGFIRRPNFRPVHPVDNRFQAPVTFRPALSEVPQQSLFPNDETAVESSSPQLLKNRQKYQPTPNRRLPGKATTLSPATIIPETTTTTERIPVATVLPDDTIYTVRPKSRPDDTKQTRIRGRIRRPGKKRVTTTSTTESALDANNELPLDENYPRIHPQAATAEQQQNLYDDNYDGSQYPSSRNPTSHQFYETSSENYPSEFILNFGNYPEQGVQREEYDQTQLASSTPEKYSDPLRAKPTSSHSTTSDIYGSESQWSTKLTRTSFQPSFAVNRLPGEPSKDQWFHESLKDTNAPEIITAAPEVSSVTLVVSSDDKRQDEEDLSMLMDTTIFGRKTNMPDHTEKINAAATVTGRPTTTGERSGSEVETNRNTNSWLMDRLESSTEQQSVIDLEKNEKKNSDPPTVRKGTRRRRVRVRVRPAVDDFVTAESQHINSAVNGLIRDQYKYNPIRESRFPIKQSVKEPVQSMPQKSSLEDFLTEILKSDTPSTTSETPETAWTMSLAMTTPMIIPDDNVETTTLEIPTTIPTTEKSEETTTMQSYSDSTSQLLQETNKNEKGEDEKTENWEKNALESALDLGYLSGKYKAKENDINKLNDKVVTNNEELNFPRTRLKPVNDERSEDSGKESVSGSFEGDEESKGGDYPKNHRAKWSEVRYPFSFDHSQAAAWSYNPRSNEKSTTSIPGLVTKNEGDTSVKTLSDYVQAIFDSMKSAEEEDTTDSKTEKPEETTTVQMATESELENEEEEKTTMKNVELELTTQPILGEEDARTMKDLEGNEEGVTQKTETTMIIDSENVTTLERESTTSESVTISSSSESLATDPPTTTPKSNTVSSNTTESILGKVLRTSTTTRVSHMTEICYRGRCVMTRPSQDDRFR